MAEDRRDFLRLNRAAAISIEQSEGSPHVLLVEQRVLVDCGRAPLAKIDRAAVVCVRVHENLNRALIDNFLRQLWVQLPVAIDELLLLDETVSVLVPLVEGLPELDLLLLGREVPSHESQRRLLKLAFVL